MSYRAQQDRVGRFALFKRSLGPFNLVFGVVMAAARNFFDLEIDSKQLARSVQNVQGTR
jgi:hypothetical protein